MFNFPSLSLLYRRKLFQLFSQTRSIIGCVMKTGCRRGEERAIHDSAWIGCCLASPRPRGAATHSSDICFITEGGVGGREEASLYPGHLKAECLFVVVGDAWGKVFSCSPVGLLEAQRLLSQNVCSIQTLEWRFNRTRRAVTATTWCCFYLHTNKQTSKCLN